MKNEFTAIIVRDGDWFIAFCPEIPGANGQGRTKDEARKSLAAAIELILQDRREMPYTASRLTRSEKLLRSSETELIAPTSSTVRLLP